MILTPEAHWCKSIVTQWAPWLTWPRCFRIKKVLPLHCNANLMKCVKYCLYTFQKGSGFIAGKAKQKAWHKSADRNIKWGRLSNIEYKWGYFTLQSSANRRTDFSLCNKSFPFRQPLLLGHCLILSAIEEENKLVYIAKKKKKVLRLECMIWWWKIEYTWLIDDNELADRRMLHAGCHVGVILRGGTGEKSQVSSKCSRVRFSEIAF